jgi:hypothetical protein
VETYILIIVLAVVFAIVIRLAHCDSDHDRIRQYVEANGGKLIDAKWMPLGPGWIDAGENRIYEVHYSDKEDNQHRAYCKTSGWSGVCFTENVTEQRAEPKKDQHSLEEENRRLREELEELKRRQA